MCLTICQNRRAILITTNRCVAVCCEFTVQLNLLWENVVFFKFHRRNGQNDTRRHHQNLQSFGEFQTIIRSESGGWQRNADDDASSVPASDANTN